MFTFEVIRYARYLDEHLCIDRNEQLNIYTVFINKVMIKDGYTYKHIRGHGYTIEEACNEYIKLAKSKNLYHFISSKEINVL